MVLQIWLGSTSLHFLDWLTFTGVRTRAELNTGITSQVTIAARRGYVDWAQSCPVLTLLMRESTLVGGNTFYICPLQVGRAAGFRRAEGAFIGSRQRVTRVHSVRRWRSAWVVNHILIGWGFEGAEEACKRENSMDD